MHMRVCFVSVRPRLRSCGGSSTKANRVLVSFAACSTATASPCRVKILRMRGVGRAERPLSVLTVALSSFLLGGEGMAVDDLDSDSDDEIPAPSILLVDDRPANLLALEAVLEPLG